MKKSYTFDTNELDYGMVYGSYRDQGAMQVTFHSNEHNDKGGDFKMQPMMIVKFLKKIGCKLHFETDRKHSYLKSIELKPWSEFEQAMRQPVDRKKKGSKIKK